MAEKEASSKQVFRWAVDHASAILTGVAIIGALYIGWNRFQTQWQEHVAPNCVETPTAMQCKLDRLEHEMIRLEQKMDQIILMMPKRHG